MNALPPGRGRFAPSPTGPLHLGNLRTALLAWLFARHAGATFVLRIEDLDRPRTRPGAAEQAIRDLRRLGLDWDEGPDVGGPHAPYTQSERHPEGPRHYREHLAQLLDAGLAYPCYCSRKDVAQAASAPHGPDTGPPYPGTCRDPDRRAQQRRRHPDRPPAYRYRASGQIITIHDRLHGAITRTLHPGADDIVLWRADSTPAYHLAVVVDDALMRIGEVVRGDDLLQSTPWQAALLAAFHYPLPTYAHVPLLRDAGGERMAKRTAAEGLDTLLAAGISPQRLVGKLAASCGIAPPGTTCTPRELLPGFRPERLAHTDTRRASAWPQPGL